MDFFAFDPAKNEMRRKRYYINSALSVAAKKRRAAEIIEVLTKQLRSRFGIHGLLLMKAADSYP